MADAMPFPVESIQVDGGSEFMADFERANRSARIEFWNRYDGPPAVAGVAPRLAEHECFHNYQRPHWALDCRTPNEYLVHLESISETTAKNSEMS
ncbi:MAG: hypothetical protein OXF31_02710 [Gammaproteobacteria bacterium]|nr:hypothetical protein [Gammaproteobacteria bacterium]